MRSLKLFLLSCFSLCLCTCAKQINELSLTLVEISIDLEDHLYFLDQNWHSWNSPVVGCEPRFGLEFDWNPACLQLEYCAALGELLEETIRLDNGHVSITAPPVISQEAGHGMIISTIELDSLFLTSLREDNDWIDLAFEFSFY